MAESDIIAQALLGASLANQNRYAEAEPLLIGLSRDASAASGRSS
jgi:hypothetical protein